VYNGEYDMQVPLGMIDGQTTALLLFCFAVLVVIVASIVLIFHWRRFGMGGSVLSFMEFIYLAGAFSLLLLAFVSMP